MKAIRGVVMRSASLGGIRSLAPILAVAVAIAALALIPPASAQAPEMPMPNESCTATLTLDPPIIAIGDDSGVGVLASGFEPGAFFSVFVGSHFFGSGTIGSDGTGATSIFIDAVTAAAPVVQVTTGSRCAVATLTIAGPLRVSCDPVIVAGIIIACPLKFE